MRLSKSRRERTWTPAFFIFSFFMRERERERERLVRLFGRVRRQRGFSSSLVLSRSRHPREQEDGERKKEKSGNARKRPRETTLLANALVPASRRIRSKRTFERRSFSSNVPFFFSFSLFRASLSLCARKCTRTQRKNPPSSGFLSLPRERKF